MRFFKRATAMLLAVGMTVSLVTTADAATVTKTSKFVQNTATKNTYGYVGQETDQFLEYSTLENDNICSRIYKPVSGDTMVVTFHGNGEGGVNGECNNYSQIAGNELSTAYISGDMQEKLHGAYVLSFQAPEDWYHDHTVEAAAVINKAKDEFGIKQIFVCGLSAGGLMTQRMLSTYPDMFDGALYSCAAISKNDTYIEGLGGEYENSTEYINDDGVHKKPTDYDTYKENYTQWLEKIAESDVPIFMIHAKNDPTISYTWTEYAYDTISSLRKDSGNETPVYYKILNTVNYGNTSYGEHFSWVKMLNNDVLDSTGTVRSLDFIAGLCTSNNKYTEKQYTIPSAGADKNANTYKFNLISEVTDGGEKITKAVIDMNGKKVDASKLKEKDFKVTAYGTDASGLLKGQDKDTFPDNFQSDLMKATKKNPDTIRVKDIYVNNKGNIVLVFKDEKPVLNYTSYSRNLAVNVRYNISSAKLTLLEEKVVKTPSKVVIKKVKPGKKKISISWKKAANAKTYQVAYKKSGSKKWSSVKTVKVK